MLLVEDESPRVAHIPTLQIKKIHEWTLDIMIVLAVPLRKGYFLRTHADYYSEGKDNSEESDFRDREN